MTMVTRQIVGYDPTTEKVAIEYAIPLDKWGMIRPLVKPNVDDPNYAYSYPLAPGVAGEMLRLMGERPKFDLHHVLECEAVS